MCVQCAACIIIVNRHSSLLIQTDNINTYRPTVVVNSNAEYHIIPLDACLRRRTREQMEGKSRMDTRLSSI